MTKMDATAQKTHGRNAPVLVRVLWGVGLVGTLLAAFITGASFGESSAHSDIRRLQSLWPELFALPVEEQRVLAETAFQCKLQSLPASASPSEVLACLIRGAEELGRHPATADMPRQLDSLIHGPGASSPSGNPPSAPGGTTS